MSLSLQNKKFSKRLLVSGLIGVFGAGLISAASANTVAVNANIHHKDSKAFFPAIMIPPEARDSKLDTSELNNDIQDSVRDSLKDEKRMALPQQSAFIPDQNYDRTIELVFAIDTTGSMGGLIDGAKQKVWRIINDVTQRQKASNQKVLVRVGLVAYRDVNDEYVTRITPLSADLDAVYSKLMDFRADGGGDTPEHVRMAMSDALNGAGWSARSVAKASNGAVSGIGRLSQVLFLVGDAPPHEDYKQYPSVQKTASSAKERGITVNAIQVGNIHETTPVWREVAKAGGGEYFAIAQSGGVQVVTTPYDTRLAELGDDMSRKGIYYGREREKVAKDAAGYVTSLAAAPSSAKADRAVNKSINMEAAYHSSDLVQAVENKTVDLKNVKTEELPDEMQGMFVEERQAYVQQKIDEREKIRQEISELSKKRESYLREQGDQSGKADAFDYAVEKALERQIK